MALRVDGHRVGSTSGEDTAVGQALAVGGSRGSARGLFVSMATERDGRRLVRIQGEKRSRGEGETISLWE